MMGYISFFEYKLGVDKEIIIISISAMGAIAGYFITHFLEIERKKLEEKTKLYRDLVSKLRIFMFLDKDSQFKIKLFEDTYYDSWLYISTSVYNKLLSYLGQYEVWQKAPTEENKKELNKKLISLMQAIRDEFIFDQKAKFKNYIFQ